MTRTLQRLARGMAFVAVLCLLGTTTPAQTPDPALQRLEREITRLGKASGGVTGATAIHIETGR
ncbi:MAG TPA: hypothetical protein VFZ34_17565, partial [Blastocatellia bacterium]|nr:hypothetical protein [Blastocatellia bacterium]